ncbi:hypothetical protein ACFSJU_02520 [Paradesertivirga mongoliensis]|uniref:Uncharacterized protein n=1 Tax=Paradesertivirga mongoliensis TaxID=2100740 RepID=A0ABW4ZGT4_9SPHI|nr:hypothetical protein [Pedobacter mongoliensis]
MKNLCLIVLVLSVLTASSQKKQNYYIEAYSSNSKSIKGFVTELNDTSATLVYRGKTYNMCYCDLRKIKVFRQKKSPFYFYPSWVGLGFIAASPFQSNLSEGLKTAGIGAGIIVFCAAMDVSFKKATKKITIDSTTNLKASLQEYIFVPPPEWKK